MAESIYMKIRRIVSGSIEDMVDSMEDANRLTVMREAVREIDRVLDESKAERNAVTAKRLHAVRQRKMYQERMALLNEKAEFAMQEEREDLAEAAILRGMEFEKQLEQLSNAEARFSEQERELEEAVASLEMKKAHLEEELNHFEQAQREAGVDSIIAGAPGNDNLERVERAEKAFNRMIGSSSGVFDKGSVENAKKVAEIETIRKDKEVEQRMEALRLQKEMMQQSGERKRSFAWWK